MTDTATPPAGDLPLEPVARALVALADAVPVNGGSTLSWAVALATRS